MSAFTVNKLNDIKINEKNEIIVDNIYESVTKELNDAKTKLDEIPEYIYGRLAACLDNYRNLRNIIYSTTKMQIVTNASLKIYEMIVQFNLIAHNVSNFNVFCNAELPGGFIIAINHYIKTMTKINNFNWVANSYISNTGSLGDKYGIYDCNKSNWLMDENMNGDITIVDNIQYIINKVKSKFPNGVNLYTSDAGIDVSNDFNNQEEQTLTLNYCQVLCGLLSLSVHGNMVTKQFTFSTPFNRSLINLLSYLFKIVYITKPLTSRPVNSEIYIICKDYNGMQINLEKYLISRVQNIKPDIPLIYEINGNLFDIAKAIYNTQTLKLNELFENYIIYVNKIYELQKKMKPVSDLLQKKWITVNSIKIIEENDYISHNPYLYQ